MKGSITVTGQKTQDEIYTSNDFLLKKNIQGHGVSSKLSRLSRQTFFFQDWFTRALRAIGSKGRCNASSR